MALMQSLATEVLEMILSIIFDNKPWYCRKTIKLVCRHWRDILNTKRFKSRYSIETFLPGVYTYLTTFDCERSTDRNLPYHVQVGGVRICNIRVRISVPKKLSELEDGVDVVPGLASVLRECDHTVDFPRRNKRENKGYYCSGANLLRYNAPQHEEEFSSINSTPEFSYHTFKDHPLLWDSTRGVPLTAKEFNIRIVCGQVKKRNSKRWWTATPSLRENRTRGVLQRW